MLFPAIDALRKDGAKSVTDAVSRLAGDRQLPGLATPENRKRNWLSCITANVVHSNYFPPLFLTFPLYW